MGGVAHHPVVLAVGAPRRHGVAAVFLGGGGMRRRNDQFGAVIRSDRGCAVDRTQRRVRAIGADHDGLIGAHFPPSVRPTAAH